MRHDVGATRSFVVLAGRQHVAGMAPWKRLRHTTVDRSTISSESIAGRANQAVAAIGTVLDAYPGTWVCSYMPIHQQVEHYLDAYLWYLDT